MEDLKQFLDQFQRLIKMRLPEQGDSNIPSKDGSGESVTSLQQICAMNVISKLPPFSRDSPALWFAQLDALFAVAGISQEQLKFAYVITLLDSELAAEIKETIICPPDCPYTHLKELLLCKLLFAGKKFEGTKPSELLENLRACAGANAMQGAPLKLEWMQRLTPTVQKIVQPAAELPVDKLAELADRLTDVLVLSADSDMELSDQCKPKKKNAPVLVQSENLHDKEIDSKPGVTEEKKSTEQQQPDPENSTAPLTEVQQPPAAASQQLVEEKACVETETSTPCSVEESEKEPEESYELKKRRMPPLTVMMEFTTEWFKNFPRMTKGCHHQAYMQLRQGRTQILTHCLHDYNLVKAVLLKRKWPFYTNPPKCERNNKFIIRGIPRGIGGDKIFKSLSSEGAPITKVVQVTKVKDKEHVKVAAYVVVVPRKISLLYLRKLHPIILNSKVLWEPYKPKNNVVRCFNCQNFGHVASNCTLKPVCVICSGPHKNTGCPRKAVKCAGCGGVHPANYKDCQRRLKILEERTISKELQAIFGKKGFKLPQKSKK